MSKRLRLFSKKASLILPKSTLILQTPEIQMIAKRSENRKNRPDHRPTPKNRRHFGLNGGQMLNNLLSET